MAMQLFNQYDPRWSGHALGSGAGELGPYGCFECVLCMIAYDAFGDMHYNPATFDDALYGGGIFQGDELPNNALDREWPTRFVTTRYSGFRADVIAAALPTPDTYVFLWITNHFSPLWKISIATHFVIAASADGAYIADPAGGVMRNLLAAYGGPAAIGATSTVRRLPQVAAQPKPPVVINQPPPVVPPVVFVPPTPMFTWSAQDGTRSAMATPLEACTAAAHAYAQKIPGLTVYINNDKGNAVATEYVALPPAPTPPTTPVPTPTPAPAHAQQPDFWGVVQNLIISLILSFRGGSKKLPGHIT